MATATLFPMGLRYNFAKLDYNLILRPDCTPGFTRVVVALLVLADEGVSLCHTRQRIMEVAGVGLTTYLAAMKWLASLGAIEEVPEPDAKSGWRIVLIWKRDPGYVPPPYEPPTNDRSDQSLAARQATRRRAADRAHAPDKQLGGARQATRPLIRESSGDSEEKEDVPSPTPSLMPTPAEPEPQPIDGTGRDGISLDSGEGGEVSISPGPAVGTAEPVSDPIPDPISDPAPARIAADAPTRAEVHAAIRGHVANLREIIARAPTPADAAKHPATRSLYRMEWAAIRDLRRGDHSEIRPKLPPPILPVPPACYAGPKLKNFDADGYPKAKPAKVPRDPAHPLDAGLAILDDFGDPAKMFGAMDRATAHFLRRWGDVDAGGEPNPITARLFRRAAQNLGGEWFRRIVLESDDPRSDNPGRVFAKAARAALESHSRARQGSGG